MTKLQQGKRKKPASAGKSPPRKKTRAVPVKDPGSKRARPILVKLPPTATPEDRQEAEHFVRVLVANKQLARKPGPLPPGATHQLETDAAGAKRLVRRRFSAL
jgi:hypothetical protein